MRPFLLVLDVSYLCHRSFHTTKGLSFEGLPTGVVYGFFKTVSMLKDEFQTDRVTFCFDHPHSFRREIYPSYKQKRRATERTIEEAEAYQGLQLQISELRQQYLPLIGFKNIFYSHGFESDDLMASIAFNTVKDEEVILVTSDQDLFQCLKGNVSIYSPNKRILHGMGWFMSTHRIKPSQWSLVKAIAGCATDEVEGIKGVGELTALKYVRGELEPSSKAYLAIDSAAGRAIVRRNRTLVELPYRDCPVPRIQEDKVDPKGWREVCRLLGMKSIMEKPL